VCNASIIILLVILDGTSPNISRQQVEFIMYRRAIPEHNRSYVIQELEVGCLLNADSNHNNQTGHLIDFDVFSFGLHRGTITFEACSWTIASMANTPLMGHQVTERIKGVWYIYTATSPSRKFKVSKKKKKRGPALWGIKKSNIE